jgi:nucleoside-diphosphate-sugar epimerase
MDYKIDPLKQSIADSWPHYLEDDYARKDWGWNPKFNLEQMTKEIIKHLTPELIKSMRS